jgi:hypothetical protein
VNAGCIAILKRLKTEEPKAVAIRDGVCIAVKPSDGLRPHTFASWDMAGGHKLLLQPSRFRHLSLAQPCGPFLESWSVRRAAAVLHNEYATPQHVSRCSRCSARHVSGDREFSEAGSAFPFIYPQIYVLEFGRTLVFSHRGLDMVSNDLFWRGKFVVNDKAVGRSCRQATSTIATWRSIQALLLKTSGFRRNRAGDSGDA